MNIHGTYFKTEIGPVHQQQGHYNIEAMGWPQAFWADVVFYMNDGTLRKMTATVMHTLTDREMRSGKTEFSAVDHLLVEAARYAKEQGWVLAKPTDCPTIKDKWRRKAARIKKQTQLQGANR